MIKLLENTLYKTLQIKKRTFVKVSVHSVNNHYVVSTMIRCAFILALNIGNSFEKTRNFRYFPKFFERLNSHDKHPDQAESLIRHRDFPRCESETISPTLIVKISHQIGYHKKSRAILLHLCSKFSRLNFSKVDGETNLVFMCLIFNFV